MRVILEERPELLQTVQLPVLVVFYCLLLELFVEVRPELALQTVRIKPKKALETVTEALFRVLQSKRLELMVHRTVEVLAQEERPEPVQRSHFTRVAAAPALPI